MMKPILFALSCLATSWLFAQPTDFSISCHQAYLAFPSLPKGVLEATAFTQTRMSYIEDAELEACSGLPKSHGYFGMIANGKGYFKANVRLVSQLSGLSISAITTNPTAEVMAYAKAFHSLYVNENGTHLEERLKAVFSKLSYLPDTGLVNDFARNAELYELFRFLNNTEYATQYHFPAYHFDLERVFGSTNLTVLAAPKIVFSPQGIASQAGVNYLPERKGILKSTEYAPAIWNPAPSCNFSSRNGTAISAITIHTIQGTYAGAISWSQNCSSSVSYHYVVRSSDGQVTQMVNEVNKAWHVGSENPYTIGYEHEGYITQASWYTTAMYTASAGITRDICASGYGINPLRTYSGASTSGTNVLGSCIKIKGHQHFPNQTHTDPGIYWDWALYYQLVNNNPSQSVQTALTGSFTDTGGNADYANDERYFALIQPAGAATVTLNFSAFNLENGWDYMYIYDGATSSSPLIGVYTGTGSPGTITSTGGALLVEFRSDCATTASGWFATWSSTVPTVPTVDAIPPQTTITAPSGWITQSFSANFTDTDNVGIQKSYYQVLDFNGTEWRANPSKGFFHDNFDQSTLNAEWTAQVGTWTASGSSLLQGDESNSNTNLWAPIASSLSNRYLFHWTGAMNGSGTNRRAGMHYFCSDPTLPNRGNSYFVFFRLDNDKVQIYEVNNDVFSLMNEVSFDFNVGQWYDYKVIYDRITGKHQVYVDNVLVQSWTDSTPLTTGDYISLRSANCTYEVNDLSVYRSRSSSALIGVGTNEELRYQSLNPAATAGRIRTIVQDTTGNLSSIQLHDLKVDWTSPAAVSSVNDGLATDISTTTNVASLSANWTPSTDQHSGITSYWYAIGTTPGGTEIQNWTDNYWDTSVTVNGLALSIGSTYYFAVRAVNGANLTSAVVSSNGQLVVAPIDPAVATFVVPNTTACFGDGILVQNNSTNATSFQWNVAGATPAVYSTVNPAIVFPASGAYTIELIAFGPGGNDTLQQVITVQISAPNTAVFAVNSDTLILPNALLTCSNASQNSNGYFWDFGDGSNTQDAQPWHQYQAPGTYNVVLTAANDACVSDTMQVTIVVLDVSGVHEMEQAQWKVYPNPAQQQLTIESAALDGRFELLDEQGRCVRKGNMKEGKCVIDVANLAGGMYHLGYIQGQQKSVKTVIISSH